MHHPLEIDQFIKDKQRRYRHDRWRRRVLRFARQRDARLAPLPEDPAA